MEKQYAKNASVCDGGLHCKNAYIYLYQQEWKWHTGRGVNAWNKACKSYKIVYFIQPCRGKGVTKIEGWRLLYHGARLRRAGCSRLHMCRAANTESRVLVLFLPRVDGQKQFKKQSLFLKIRGKPRLFDCLFQFFGLPQKIQVLYFFFLNIEW